MNLFGVEFMDDNQLLEIGAEGKKHTNEINQEWKKRHGLNFPYVMTDDGVVVNRLLMAFVGDMELDRRTLEQVKKMREEKGLKK